MAGTMIPVVHGEPSQTKMPTVLIAHTLGSVVGGMFCGLAVGSMHSVLQFWVGERVLLVDVALGLFGFALALRVVRLARLPLPESRWQVPRKWLVKMPATLAASLYGLCLGAAVFTRMTSGIYLVMAWIVLAGGVRAGVTTMAIYGLSRSLPLWTLYLLGGREGRRRQGIVERVALWEPAAAFASAVFLVMAGGFVMLHRG